MNWRITTILPAMFFLWLQLPAQSWESYRDSADFFKKSEDVDRALYYYGLSIKALPKDSLSSESHISILTNNAYLLYRFKNQFEESAKLYLEAGEIIKKLKGSNNDAFAFNSLYLGIVNYYMRKYENAENFYKESKSIWEKLYGKNSRQCSISCNALGVLYNDWEKYELALAEHQEARMIRKALFTKENLDYAQSTNNLAAIYWKLGENDKAEPLALEAKEIRGRLKEKAGSAYAISCVNLANIYRDMGKYEEAEALYIEAKNEREAFFTKDNNEYALSCDILADLYYYMKKYNSAESLYLEAKEIRERILSKTDAYYGQSCSSLSALYRELGRYEEAKSLALEADTIWKLLKSSGEADKAINDNNLGSLYFSLNEYEKAESYLLSARETWEKNLGENHPFVSDNSLSLARVYWNKNEPQKADAYYRKALDAQISQTDRMFSFTTENEKQLYQERINGATDEYQSFYFRKMNKNNLGLPYSIALLKRNQILSSSRQMRHLIFSSGDTSLLRKYDEWIRLRKQLASLYAKGDASLKNQAIEVTEKAALLEKELVRSSNAFEKATHSNIDWSDVQASLGNNDAAIEFVEFNYFNGKQTTDSIFYVALVLRKEMKEPEMVFLFEKKQLDSLFRQAWRGDRGINSFYTRGLKTGRNNSISRKAYSLIWGPIESKLQGIKKVFYAPSGLLYRVAFAALPVDSANLLSDRYDLIQLSTTASIKEQKDLYVNSGDQIYLFGGIQYSKGTTQIKQPKSLPVRLTARSGFEYLPGTAKEVQGIADAGRLKKYYPAILKGPNAKEDTLKSLDAIRSPAIIHIATHGFFFDDPEKNNEKIDSTKTGGDVFRLSSDPLFRSGLLFAGANDSWKRKPVMESGDDGILTAYEVSNLFLPNTKLVVLSACETALGDIKGSEGVYGLQRAFKIAGVKNLIMSLWKVPDEETAEFMQLFYNNLFDGNPIQESFQQAQSVMKNKYRRDPFKWAAWILVK